MGLEAGVITLLVTSQPLTLPLESASKAEKNQPNYKSENSISNERTFSIHVFFFSLFFSLLSIQYILANKSPVTTCTQTKLVWNESIFKSIGKANFVLQRQAKKKTSSEIKKEVVSCTRCRSIFIFFLCSGEKLQAKTFFYGFSLANNKNQIDKKLWANKSIFLKKSKGNQILVNPSNPRLW